MKISIIVIESIGNIAGNVAKSAAINSVSSWHQNSSMAAAGNNQII